MTGKMLAGRKNKVKYSNQVSPEDVIQRIKGISSESPGKNLESLIREAGLCQTLIIESDSRFRSKKFCDVLTTLISGPVTGLEVEKYSAADLSTEKAISRILLSSESLSLFSTSKLILIRDAELLKVAQIARFLSVLPLKTDTFLIFQCKKIPAGGNWELLAKMSSICSFLPFTQNELSKWIAQESKRRGAAGVSSDGIKYLLNDVACSIELLDHIIEKASLLTSEGDVISLQTLKNVSETSLQKDSFDLFSAIAKKDYITAQLVLHSMIQNGAHPLQILGFFNKAIKSIAINKSGSSSTNPVYCSDLHNSWFTRKLSPEKFSTQRLNNALKILAELDSDMKGKNFGEHISLQSKLINI